METIFNIGDAFFLENKIEYQVYDKVEIDENTYLVVRQVPVGNKNDFFDIEKFPLVLVNEKLDGEDVMIEKVSDEKILEKARQMGVIL